ncbi:oxidoreductase of aldo/keto reductase family, subgroup 1 [Rubellimicrobium mesophilum DSM 19309]|uniref:Oxidoreductase of aldo/keto reductase family, subgroup 1 n=1 Tax=Rubellimicrobium mesophilum DSM 19309 TaxID=442562 RepID=A0A017HV24_9RHOB|nr:aldo/keto reductase [Rubellimicrobium mesophilum]EYD78246.1 oxidoreductase of aldo/keto reductase family, subgroup 1 [Rubellimicrobium mesophilum DSM 19309]
MTPPSPLLTLNDGRTMPQMGFGLWQVPERETARLVVDAVKVGYRLFDGAALYGNERGLGEGVRHAEVPRDDIFVTTKVWNDRQGYDSTLRAVEESLERLVLDRVDLVLIHWPAPARDLYVETWRALVRLREEGVVTSVGVSNFLPEHLDRIVAETGVVPVVNQVELHPELPQGELRARHAESGIVTQSWTPLGQSRSFGSAAVRKAAERTGASPAQVILAWHLALGCSVIPRSTKPERLEENLRALEVELTPEEVAAIEALENGHRTGPDPHTFS